MSFEGAKEFKAPQPYIRNKLDPILAIERRWKLFDGRRFRAWQSGLPK